MERMDRPWFRQRLCFNWQGEDHDYLALVYREDGNNQGYRYRLVHHIGRTNEDLLLSGEQPLGKQELARWYTFRVECKGGMITVWRGAESLIQAKMPCGLVLRGPLRFSLTNGAGELRLTSPVPASTNQKESDS